MKIKYIIVGQGLAGTLLAFEFIKHGQPFIAFDQPGISQASSVAAGIVNPVVFRRITKSWMVDEAFPIMETVYHELEELLEISIYNRCRILKILDKESKLLWKEKVIAHQLDEYLETEPGLTYQNPPIYTPFGVGVVKKAGHLNIQQLILRFRGYLEMRQWIRTEPFRFENLHVKPQNVYYKDLEADKIIFCEGASVSNNPFFSALKFKHSKGEILEVSIPELNTEEIINGEVFLMPTGHQQYKAGATYNWDELDENPTETAREVLLAKLQKFVHSPIKVISQQAGIRPITHDRKPVIGFHPYYPSIGLFNGLASKGALLGPWVAQQIAEYVLGLSDNLNPALGIGRYFKLKQ